METITIAPDGDVTLIFMKHEETLSKENIAAHEVRILVSSEKLRCASPVFKRMLQGTFHEGERLRLDGHVEIRLPDDPDYFAFLLDTIHDRDGKGVPRPSRTVLAGLCFLIDKYFMHAGLIKSLPIWSKIIRPKGFSNKTELSEILFIYWAAGQAASLSTTMREAVYRLESPLKSDVIQLPLPTWIIDHINGARKKALRNVFESIRVLLETNWVARNSCRVCGEIESAAMPKTVKKHIWLVTRQHPDFHNVQLKKLKYILYAIRIPSFCTGHYPPDNLQKAIQRLLGDLHMTIRWEVQSRVESAIDIHGLCHPGEST